MDEQTTATEQAEGRNFPCEGCGADLRFHIGAQSLKCEFCAAVKVIDLDPSAAVREQDFGAILKRVAKFRANAAETTIHTREVTCENCGGAVRFVGALASDECAYCGTAIQVENAYTADDRIPVDGVLPFKVDRTTARQRLAQWVKSRWFAPNEFRRRGVRGEFNGVYLPYWTYDAMTTTQWSGQRGDHYTVWVGSGKNRRMETRTRWTHCAGTFQRFFDDVAVPAATGWRQKRLEALEPWPFEQCLPFRQEFLSGYLASTYDVEIDAGFGHARERVENALRGDIRREIGGNEQRIHQLDVYYDAVTYKHLLLPVWTLTYRYGKKPHQVFINAGTGEVQGDRPWSWIKITSAILSAAAIIGAAIYFFNARGL